MVKRSYGTPPQAELATLSVLPAKQAWGKKARGSVYNRIPLAGTPLTAFKAVQKY